MRISLNPNGRRRDDLPPETLADLVPGESGILTGMDLPEADALRLMELGFLPGSVIVAARSAPGGDPRVYRVEGSEFALRGETARRMRLDGSTVALAGEEGR